MKTTDRLTLCLSTANIAKRISRFPGHGLVSFSEVVYEILLQSDTALTSTYKQVIISVDRSIKHRFRNPEIETESNRKSH